MWGPAPRTLWISARGTDQDGLAWALKDSRLLVRTARWWSLRMTMQRSCAAITSVTLSSCNPAGMSSVIVLVLVQKVCMCLLRRCAWPAGAATSAKQSDMGCKS